VHLDTLSAPLPSVLGPGYGWQAQRTTWTMMLKENAQELALIVKETGADQGLSL
jgi:hypothetical protein